MSLLLVAEKPSLARAITAALAGDAEVEVRQGSCQIHCFHGPAVPQASKEKNPLYKVTSVKGHMQSLDFEGDARSWESDPAQLFLQASVRKKVDSKGLAHMLERESKGVDAIILFLDCDAEGENICFEVLQACSKGPKVFRPRFSAVTRKELMRALLEPMKGPDKLLSRSVDARQELDLRIGVAFTREQTRFFGNRYADLDSRLISYGPCQTPTLGFCVERAQQIARFVPEPFWRLDVNVSIMGAAIPLEWRRGRLFDKQVAKFFLNSIKEEKEALVVDVHAKAVRKQRPTGLNTVALLKVMSKLGMGPGETMRAAEQLYMQGLISYPRTETTAFHAEFNAGDIFRDHRGHSIWGEYVKSVERLGLRTARPGVDAGDHHPITPLRCAEPREISNWGVYEQVCRHFFAVFSPDAEYTKHMVSWSVGGEQFKSSTIEMKTPGYTLITQEPIAEQRAPELKKGDKVAIQLVTLTEGETSPPPYLSESELITLMEKHGIGTDASISSHIENILSRQYVHLGSGRQLVPSRLGICLYNGYHKIDPDLVLPYMRSEIEKNLTLIAEGKADYATVVNHVLRIFNDKFAFFRQHIDAMDSHFSATYTKAEDSASASKPLSRCGNCRQYMKLVMNKRLICEKCDVTYELPQSKGVIKLFQEKTCPLDNFELVLWRGGSGQQTESVAICPRCYNDPPFESVDASMPCNQCVENACPLSLPRNAVMPCNECKDGTMTLDPASAPFWKLNCNSRACNYCLFLPERAKSIVVEQDVCLGCGTTLLSVDFNIKKTPLQGGKTLLEKACIVCHPTLNAQCRPGTTKITHGKRRKGKGGKRGKKRGGRQDPKLSFNKF